jgi:hypothetical protein
LLLKDATEDDEERDEGVQAREPRGGEEQIRSCVFLLGANL